MLSCNEEEKRGTTQLKLIVRRTIKEGKEVDNRFRKVSTPSQISWHHHSKISNCFQT